MQGREQRTASKNRISLRTVERSIQKIKNEERWRVKLPNHLFNRSYFVFDSLIAARAFKASLVDLVAVELSDRPPLRQPTPTNDVEQFATLIDNAFEFLHHPDASDSSDASTAPAGAADSPSSPSPPQTPSSAAKHASRVDASTSPSPPSPPPPTPSLLCEEENFLKRKEPLPPLVSPKKKKVFVFSSKTIHPTALFLKTPIRSNFGRSLRFLQ